MLARLRSEEQGKEEGQLRALGRGWHQEAWVHLSGRFHISGSSRESKGWPLKEGLTGVGSRGALSREDEEVEESMPPVVVSQEAPQSRLGRAWEQRNKGSVWLLIPQAGISHDQAPVWT